MIKEVIAGITIGIGVLSAIRSIVKKYKLLFKTICFLIDVIEDYDSSVKDILTDKQIKKLQSIKKIIQALIPKEQGAVINKILKDKGLLEKSKRKGAPKGIFKGGYMYPK